MLCAATRQDLKLDFFCVHFLYLVESLYFDSVLIICTATVLYLVSGTGSSFSTPLFQGRFVSPVTFGTLQEHYLVICMGSERTFSLFPPTLKL